MEKGIVFELRKVAFVEKLALERDIHSYIHSTINLLGLI